MLTYHELYNSLKKCFIPYLCEVSIPRVDTRLSVYITNMTHTNILYFGKKIKRFDGPYQHYMEDKIYIN